MGRMMLRKAPRTAARARRLAAVLSLAAACLALPAAASAKVVTVGPRLSGAATLDTNDGLGYEGVDTAVPPAPDAPNGVVHTAHYGADTAIWNTTIAGHSGAMPHAGQAVAIRLEGCAVPAAGDPTPLNQIHFQTLQPQGAQLKVQLSSAPFALPVCGEGGASGSTVTTYRPYNLCVGKGDFVAFNDEGGFEEPMYRSGVPYRVLAPVRGASSASFIRSGGTGNGAVFSPAERGAMEGWASRSGVALMMQVDLGTGADARYVCPTGRRDAPRVLPAMRISPQKDGINRARIVRIAIYCRPASGCHGGASLELLSGGHAAKVGAKAFSLPGNATTHLPIRVSPLVLALIRRRHVVSTELVAHMGGRTFSQHVSIAIL